MGLAGLNKDDQKVKEFVSGASERHGKQQLDENAKPTKSFTTPMNEFEIELLQQLSDKTDISMRKLSRRLLVKAMKELEQELESKES